MSKLLTKVLISRAANTNQLLFKSKLHTQFNSFLLLPCPSIKLQKNRSFSGQGCPELLLDIDSRAPIRVLAKMSIEKKIGQVHWGSTWHGQPPSWGAFGSKLESGTAQCDVIFIVYWAFRINSGTVVGHLRTVHIDSLPYVFTVKIYNHCWVKHFLYNF